MRVRRLVSFHASSENGTTSTCVRSSLLFEVGASDPVMLVGVAAVLALVIFAACRGPGRRAGRTDPAAVLRGVG